MTGDYSHFTQDIAHNSSASMAWQNRLAAIGSDINFNMSVLLFAIGIGVYFALPQEPNLKFVTLTFFGLLALFLVFRRETHLGKGLVWIVLLLIMGVFRATWHTDSLTSTQLPDQDYSYSVKGWVSAIEKSGRGERYVIDVLSIENKSKGETPKRVRVRVTKAADPPINAGDTIEWRVSMSAPPGPAFPGGYDPGQAAFFKSIGGFGFGYGAPVIKEDAELSPYDQYRRSVVRLRYGMADRIVKAAPRETAGLQAALMTGVRRFIPEQQTENLRVAGLAHILAISGLHMGLLAGGVYAVMTLLLACILPLSRRYDIRKPAAIIGIIAASSYLVISGASVATQRAWIMAVIVFLAVILDRRAVSMRSVCVAALLTLWLRPESLISVGFQMSFAAVAALVLTYEYWQSIRPLYRKPSFIGRGVGFFSSLSVTSLVAGFATAGFALFHFNRFAKYGLFGNLLAMPIFSMAVMPLAVLSLLAIPFGLEQGPLWLMGHALHPILSAANWVASWPGAVTYIVAPAQWVLAAYGLGFALICIAQGKTKLLGIGFVLLSLMGWVSVESPDLRISDKGKVAYWDRSLALGQRDYILFVDDPRSDSYGRDQFIQRAGRSRADLKRINESLAACDAMACRVEIGSWKISILQNPSEVSIECEASDIVVLSVRRAGPVARRHCDAVLIDEKRLRETGGLDVYLQDELKIKAARPTKGNRRPWQ